MRKSVDRLVLVATVALGPLGPLGCTGHDSSTEGVEPTEAGDRTTPAVAAGAASAPAQSVILTLKTKGHVVHVYASGGGARQFTISNVDGEVLATRVDEAELERTFPELHQAYDTALAGDPGLDASLTIETDPAPALGDAR